MSETPETPQQRQLRIRQQKREAKLKAQGQERLDKITKLSGRTPEMMRDEPTPSIATPTSLPSTPAITNETDPDVVLPTSAMFGQTSTPEQQRLQEEYMKVLLGGGPQSQAGQGRPGGMDENDPMIKMMQTMLGGMSGDPNAPGAGDLPFSPDDISKMTGMPSFLTNMFMGGSQQPPASPAQVKNERNFSIIRTIISVLVALYTIFTVDKSLSTFGQNPPTPATAQNPFVIFLMAELLINGTRTFFPGRPATGGLRRWYNTGKDAARDGAMVIFVLGLYTWFKGPT